MKSRVFSIPFSVFVLVMWVYYPLFAQVSAPGVSGGPQAITSPQIPSLPQSTSAAPDIAPSGIQIPFRKSETNIQPLTGQKQGLQEQTQQQNKQNSGTIEHLVRSPVAVHGTNLSQLSPIETAFQNILQTRTSTTTGAQLQPLRQFGYAIFGLPVSTFAPVDDVPISSEYVLGPGDELRVIVWGAMENTYAQTVDHYGRIYLPTVGPIRVWGLTFSQAEKLILSYLSQYYKGFQSSVTMGHLRTIKIYVVGEVYQPGSYDISALSSLTNALVAAGGPSTLGTLR
ncbi:MAG: polysaccharide biosynthesis/export family protein, partial [Planctomycetes bacterium]|nr:polysaccharide biosynthesis/export family protein [Planctomycetota bacterium]